MNHLGGGIIKFNNDELYVLPLQIQQLRNKFKDLQEERLKLSALLEFISIALLNLLYSSTLLSRFESVHLISKLIPINHLLNRVDIIGRKGVVEFIKDCNYLTYISVFFNW